MNSPAPPVITLDQARALDALAREGTFVKAAAALHKGHTAVLYALRTLEDATGLRLLDRSGYRTRLTPAGGRVLEAARKLLEAERGVRAVVDEIRGGWEPYLRIVFDGIFPAEPILRAVGELAADGAPTRIDVAAEFLSGVEAAFVRDEADLMISVLPPERAVLQSIPLPALPACLVAHRRHPLARHKGWLTAEALAEHVVLTVHGSDPRLELSTAGLDQRSRVQLNDFAAKKAAILSGMGFGWMPEYLIQSELERGTVRRLRFRDGNTHEFRPRLYHRPGVAFGRAAARVVELLSAPRSLASLPTRW